jgi:hypothetical protein
VEQGVCLKGHHVRTSTENEDATNLSLTLIATVTVYMCRAAVLCVNQSLPCPPRLASPGTPALLNRGPTKHVK